MKELAGVFAPITTPFRKDGSVDLGALASNMRRYATSGLHGYFALGSNGENKSLTPAEKAEVLACVSENMNKAQILIAGSIFESTRETIDFAREAQSIGADYIALLPPSYFKSQMNDAALIKYFTDVADAVTVPCTLYKAPQFAGGLDISLNVIMACARHGNIAGLKDSSAGGIERLLASVPDGFKVLSGSANTFLTALLNGGSGGVISLANFLPQIVLKIYEAYLEKDLALMKTLNRELVQLNVKVSGKNGVASVKYAMDKTGFTGGDPRLPLLPLTDNDRNLLDEILATVQK